VQIQVDLRQTVMLLQADQAAAADQLVKVVEVAIFPERQQLPHQVDRAPWQL
jgi:hypothetical protein